MESIRKYVEKFFKTTKRNMRYSMSYNDCASAINEIRYANSDSFQTACTLFDYGYAKGYRAAMAEMKKGGVKA